MAISQLSLTDFRNLRSTTLDFDSGLNLVCGDNGSGKTSMLEAIFVLCQAQSFRTHQLKQCVNRDKNGFLLFGRFHGHKAGISKNEQKLEIHVDGEAVKRRSDLVRRAPINIVNANSFELIDGAPQNRRRFLDWCLFHVEPDYADQWVAFQHALRQRNRLLKSRRDLKTLDYWDEHLLAPSLEISRMRRHYSEALEKIVHTELAELVDGLELGLEYRPGWGARRLADTLRRNRERDLHAGFTQYGIHRDDLRFESEQKLASEVLSRGQGKRLCLALLIGLLKLVGRAGQKQIILLIDDLHSELDLAAQTHIYQQLGGLDLQLFVSNIEARFPAAFDAKDVKMFHVEHGIIKPRNFS